MSAPSASVDSSRIEAVRFRDDDPELFGVQVTEAPCEESYLQGLRDHLSHAVEVVPDLFPGVARVIERVRARLVPDAVCRSFISSSPEPQAYCVAGKDARTMILGLTSGLVELMDLDELAFVVGHEMGHHLMGHHRRVPPGDSAVEAVNYSTLQRMAEISADRVGLLACPSEDAFRAILKTASGLGAPHLRFDVDAFNDQLRRLQDVEANPASAYATHPPFTVRCRALTLFEMSEPYWAATGRPGRAPLSLADLEESVAADLAASTGYHPAVEMEKSVRLALIWLMLRLFIGDGRFRKPEQAFMRDNFDPETADNAIEFVRAHGPVAVCRKYQEAVEKLAAMQPGTREAVCEVMRRAASVASGSDGQKLRLLEELHRRLGASAPPAIEPWEGPAGLLASR